VVNLTDAGSDTSSIGELTLIGDGNAASATNIRSVVAEGDGNVVKYAGTKPEHSFEGDGNVLLPAL